MKVCIVGLGAIGGLFAGWMGSRLPAGRVELSALARGPTLTALQAQGGLLLQDAQGGTRCVPLQAHDRAEALGPQDLVIVAVKAHALALAAPAVRALCGPQTQVLAALNGVPWWFFDGLPGAAAGLQLQSVDPLGQIARQIPTAQVLGCVVHASSTAVVAGSVRPVNGNGLIIGRPHGQPDDGEPATKADASLGAVATVLQEAGFAVTLSARIQRDVWFKLWGNMTMNPISALTGATCDRILDDPLVRNFTSAVMLEARAIGAAIGIPIDQEPETRHAVTRKLGTFKTSMLQDSEAGRTLELDALLGAVREIGQHLQMPSPNIDALFGLTRLMAQSRGLYPRG